MPANATFSLALQTASLVALILASGGLALWLLPWRSAEIEAVHRAATGLHRPARVAAQLELADGASWCP